MFPIAYRNYKGVFKVNPERFPDKRVPQPQIILDGHITKDTSLTHVDFVPSFIKKNKDIPVFHGFSSLVALANDWLNDHPGWDIINCETVTRYYNHAVDGVDYSGVVKMLRIWIKKNVFLSTSSMKSLESSSSSSSVLYLPVSYPKQENKIHLQQKYNTQCTKTNQRITKFWFKDFKPRKDGLIFESLDKLIDKINYAILNGQINGKILQIETIKCSANDDWTFNSEITYCNNGRTTRDINRYNNMVIVFRIFFLIGDLFNDELVLADFVPYDLSSHTVNNRSCEKFSSLIERSANWLRQNTELTYHSAQSVDIEVSDLDADTIETRITYKRKEENDKEIRFLRVYCTRPNQISKLFIPINTLNINNLTSQLYLTAIGFNAKTVNEDINEWYKEVFNANDNNKAKKILNIETVVTPAFVNDQTGLSFQRAIDETLNCNSMEGRFKYSFMAIRVYYDEKYPTNSDSLKILRLPSNSSSKI